MRGRAVLALLVLTAVALMLLDARRGPTAPLAGPLDSVRRGTDAVVGPLQRAVGGTAAVAGEALGGLPRIARYREENERLRRENDELRRGLVEQEELEATRRSSAALLRFKDAGSYTTVLARVVGAGAFQPFGETVVLDAGSADGVREGQTVASGRGLVGRTVRVGPQTTTVVLLSDPGFSAGVRLSRAPRSLGVVSGAGEGRLRLRLVELAGAEPLQVGDPLVTAGSEAFVPGLPVGVVVRVDPGGAPTEVTADVEPYTDLGALDLVQVVTEGPRRAPRVPIPPARP